MLDLMVNKLVERKQREMIAVQGHSINQTVPDDQFFKQAGIKVQKVKNGY
jgi:hypothetical protein